MSDREIQDLMGSLAEVTRSSFAATSPQPGPAPAFTPFTAPAKPQARDPRAASFPSDLAGRPGAPGVLEALQALRHKRAPRIVNSHYRAASDFGMGLEKAKIHPPRNKPHG